MAIIPEVLFLNALNGTLTDSAALAGDLPENLRDAVLTDVENASIGVDTVFALKSGAFIKSTPSFININDYEPIGDGVSNDADAFNTAKATNKLVTIAKPATAYNFTTTISTDANAWLPDPTISWANLTDSGQFDLSRGFFTDQLDGGNIWRFADRVFVGQAASKFAGNFSTSAGEVGNSSWSDPADASTYIGVNAQFLSITGGAAGAGGNSGGYAVVGLARGTDSLGTGIIGVAGAIINDKASGRAWGLYSDLQHETGAWVSNGLEVAAKNKSTDNLTYSPYTATFGVFGARFVGGGDPAEGGVDTNPSNAAIIVIKNDAATNGWNRGIVFRNDALTGTDGSIGSSTNATAIAMARRHAISWYAPDDVIGATIVSTVTDGDNLVVQQFADNAVSFLGVNGKQMARFSHVASGVNYPSFSDAATGGSPSFSVLGDDTNINLNVLPKGTTGLLRLRGGSNASRIEISDTGLGFFGSPVARKTGWGVATGSATRTTFDTTTVTTAQLAERVKALIDDLHSTAGYGLITT